MPSARATRALPDQPERPGNQPGTSGEGPESAASAIAGFDVVVLGAGLVLLAALALVLSRGFSFIVDEWDILALHVHGNLLTPYNGHLSTIPVLIYQGLAHTIGLEHYLPFLLVALVVFLAIPVAFALTHRRLVDPVLVTIAALAIAWSWAASGNILYGFLVNFNLPILMLIIVWWLIRRATLRHDLWATAALTVALATSSVGVVVAFAIGVELVFARAPLRRLVRFAPPVALWVVWWIFGHDATKPASLADRISYAWHTSVAILAGFTLGWKPGAAISAAVIVAVVVMAGRRWRTIDAHVLAIGATLVFFVALSAFSRAGDIALNPPDSVRYVWVGDVLIVAGLVWCVRGLRIRPVVWAAAGAVCVIGAVGLVGNLRDYRGFVLDEVARTRPFLVGAEAAGPRADPNRILPLNLIPVTVGDYLELVRTVGSPVAGTTFADLGSETSRSAADRILVDETVRLTAGSARPSCPGGWRPVTARASAADVTLAPGSSLAFETTTTTRLRLRRLAATFPPPATTRVPAATATVVVTTPDDLAWPWHIRVDEPIASPAICTR